MVWTPDVAKPSAYTKKLRGSLAYDSRRGSSSERGYNYRWRKYRLSFLAKHPLCVACEARGLVSGADVVDHIKPHKGDKALFWEKSNHQPLCYSCHSIKTAREDGGFGNKSMR